MVTAKKVVRRRPPEDWRKALDNILRKKRPVKLILLHTCEEDAEVAVNPELILEIGNTMKAQGSPVVVEQVRILESRTGDLNPGHEIVLTLASRPFEVGDRVKFTGMTRITMPNGIEGKIRASSSPMVSGWQITLGAKSNEMALHNYSVNIPRVTQGPETGYVEKLERPLVVCGFVACCGEDRKIETRESMEQILLMIVRAGIGTIFDPRGEVSMGGDESIGRP